MCMYIYLIFGSNRITGNFTMDVIASTGFGLEIDSQLYPDTPFVKHAKAAFAALKITNPVLLAMCLYIYIYIYIYVYVLLLIYIRYYLYMYLYTLIVH